MSMERQGGAGRLLGRDEITELLDELGRRLDQRGVQAEMFLVGGGAMALAYSTRRTTRDIDAVFEPKSVIYEEARRMADDLGLPTDWLNDGVKGLLPDRPDSGEQVTHSSTGISLVIASPEYLFAMKGAAARQEADTDDLIALAHLLGITTAHEALGLIERFYDRSRLTAKTQFVIEALFDSAEFTDDRISEDLPSSGRVRGYTKRDGTVVRPHRRRS